MPRIVRTFSLAVLLYACGGAPPPTSQTGDQSATEAPRVTGAEARQMVSEGALLLDVTPDDRADRSLIEGRTHIPTGALRSRENELPRDRPIVVYCLGGRASPEAGAMLRADGFDAYVMGARANWDR